jgi:diguanylate cyclase (GGDEF)-like protein
VRGILTEAGLLALREEWRPHVVLVGSPNPEFLAQLLNGQGTGQVVVLTENASLDCTGAHAVLPDPPAENALVCTVRSAAAWQQQHDALVASERLQTQILALASHLGALLSPEAVTERALEGAAEAFAEPGSGALLAVHLGLGTPVTLTGCGRFGRVESELDVPSAVVDALRVGMAMGSGVERTGAALLIGIQGAAGVSGALYLERSSVPRAAHDLCAMFARLLGQALSNAVLFRQSTVDALTGLYSREFGLKRLDETLAVGARHGAATAVLALDVDHFKLVNDTFGHAGGDVVLAALGRLLRDSLRVGDLATRLGGEELLVVLPRTEVDGAVIVAERLRRLIAAWRGEHAGNSLHVTVSIGVATAEPGEKNAAELLARADDALYAAKGQGRNRVVCAGN